MFEPAGELEVDSSSSESEDDVTDNQTSNNSKKRKISTPLWKKHTDFSKVFPSIEINKLANDYPELTLKSPFELWRDFMTDTLTQNILEQILLYARRDKNNVNFDLHKAELLRFFGIIISSGYHKLPSERGYWSNKLDLAVPIVSEELSSKRFLQIKSMFHLVDNTTLEGNSYKMDKVMLLYDHLNSSFIKYRIFHQLLSIDESMVSYYGRHSCKMFIRGKPFDLVTNCGVFVGQIFTLII